jgi:hypothetical protein
MRSECQTATVPVARILPQLRAPSAPMDLRPHHGRALVAWEEPQPK